MNKFIGSTLILSGTAVGAGMLALPMVSAGAGFDTSALLTIIIWGLMTTTALLVLEVNLAFEPHRNNFGTMAKETLGRTWQLVAWSCTLLLLYSLTGAYIAGVSTLLTDVLHRFLHINTPAWVSALLFTLILGSTVYWSTRAVDIANRWLISFKGLLLIITIVLLSPHINLVKLINQSHHAKYIWAAAPIFLTSFGFHHVIPSLTNYVGKNSKAMRKIIIAGATIPLIIYLAWLSVTLGIIPLAGDHSFTQIAKHHDSVALFIGFIDQLIKSKWVTLCINGFSNIAVTTSFLGVSLGLFDFLADGFRRPNNRTGRFQTALLTFTPPLIFAIFYPGGFVMALGYAAIFIAILQIILPTLMVYKLRKSTTLTSPYRHYCDNFLLFLIGCAGVALIVLQISGDLNLLPTLH